MRQWGLALKSLSSYAALHSLTSSHLLLLIPRGRYWAHHTVDIQGSGGIDSRTLRLLQVSGSISASTPACHAPYTCRAERGRAGFDSPPERLTFFLYFSTSKNPSIIISLAIQNTEISFCSPLSSRLTPSACSNEHHDRISSR